MDKKIQVCCGGKCLNNGASRILEIIEAEFNTGSVEMIKCMDYCERGPNVISDGKIFHDCRTRDIVERLKIGDGVIIKKLELSDLNLDDDNL